MTPLLQVAPPPDQAPLGPLLAAVLVFLAAVVLMVLATALLCGDGEDE